MIDYISLSIAFGWIHIPVVILDKIKFKRCNADDKWYRKLFKSMKKLAAK